MSRARWIAEVFIEALLVALAEAVVTERDDSANGGRDEGSDVPNGKNEAQQ